jgi:putative membrane protein
MVLRWLMASLHLLALPLGLAAVWARGRALRSVRTPDDLPRVFVADNLWGLAAALWLSTGLVRLLAGLEKATSYYLHDRVFYAKMSLFVLILLLEIWPIVTLIRWRGARRRGTAVDIAPAPALARISLIQAWVVVLMVFSATALARGFFY